MMKYYYRAWCNHLTKNCCTLDRCVITCCITNHCHQTCECTLKECYIGLWLDKACEYTCDKQWEDFEPYCINECCSGVKRVGMTLDFSEMIMQLGFLHMIKNFDV